MTTPGGSSPSAARLYSAGTSLRCVRSPVAPKITMLHGCGTGRAANPSRSGFGSGWSDARFIPSADYEIFADWIIRIDEDAVCEQRKLNTALAAYRRS